ncbi:ATP-dependent DNA ligase [Microbacterium sp. Marseille-Q6965]|uniref:ATP-dependent DNA ligase n=1 Tax=Microbacterium sp. Marseille-Q6965 TaxID=2965072 RepID=UPI0021B7DAA6|nr:ATP-dependent DNA ligase [Microbacterium sp. Marseille-Q6965]
MAGSDAAAQTVRVGSRRVRLTNLGKVIFPETGTTKGDVIGYYSRIAPLLLPHVADRPVTRKRWVDGVGTEDEPLPSFFAKDLEAGAPDWIPRRAIAHSSGPKEYPLIEEAATLVYLAQVASLELHVPQWRFDDRGERRHPDRLVLDLDPGPGVGLAECAEVARWARAILSDMGLDPLPVTSGSKGIHLYASLPGEQSSDAISAVARELARALEADHRDLVVSTMSKAARPGKVFVDWSQNNGKKTTIAPYSLRGRARPWVAAPRTWEELDDPDLRHLLFEEVLERAERIGDPLAALAPRDGGPLASYIAKRRAEHTPEPVPATPHPDDPGAGNRFVIQEHHATRLHWDVRLERDGVLVNWAVPKGIPATTKKNNLAVQTENHPIEYLDFHGVIPKGQYGAGVMTIWDAGTYEAEKWRDDEVIVTLTGREDGPLGGPVRVALIRTDGRGEKSTWLMHRTKTDAQGQPQADGPEVVPWSEPPPLDEPPADPPPDDRFAPMLAVAGSTGAARDVIRRGGDPWIEFKWDGVRAIAHWTGGVLRLRARSGTDITLRYPELSNPGAASIDADEAVLDGEIVALDAAGRPSFSRLQERMHLTRAMDIQRIVPRVPVRLYLFDALEVDGRDLAARPLVERREALERIAGDPGTAIDVPPVAEDLDAALETARRLDLEGVVVKDPRSPYRRGVRSEEWLKLKLTRTQSVVIGGINPGQGNREGTIGSLLLGIPDGDRLRYVGKVGTGFGDRELRRLQELLRPVDESPFAEVPGPQRRLARWVAPEHVGEVEFSEWTPGGSLRHPRWRGLRPDLTPGDVAVE